MLFPFRKPTILYGSPAAGDRNIHGYDGKCHSGCLNIHTFLDPKLTWIDQFDAFFCSWGKWENRAIPLTCGGVCVFRLENENEAVVFPRSPGYDEKYPDILTSILHLVHYAEVHFLGMKQE